MARFLIDPGNRPSNWSKVFNIKIDAYGKHFSTIISSQTRRTVSGLSRSTGLCACLPAMRTGPVWAVVLHSMH